jgi:hypothetical protein
MNDRKERDSYWCTLIQKNAESGMSAARFANAKASMPNGSIFRDVFSLPSRPVPSSSA